MLFYCVVTVADFTAKISYKKLKSFEKFFFKFLEDSSAFMENMLIQATDYELGSCWIGVRGIEINGVKVEDQVRKILNIDPKLKILSLCILGKTARSFNFSKKIDLTKRIHRT